MKTLLLSAGILLATHLSYGQTNLPEETPIKVKLIQEISSKKAQVGDVVRFRLSENLMQGNAVLIDTTAEVIGEVIEAQKARSLGRPGKLDFTVNTVKSVDGQNVKLRTMAKTTTGKDKTGGVVAAAVIFTPVALFIKGQEVIIEKNREFVVFVNKDYTITGK